MTFKKLQKSFHSRFTFSLRILSVLVLCVFLTASLPVRPVFAAKVRDNNRWSSLGTAALMAVGLLCGMPSNLSFWQAASQPFVQAGVAYGLKQAGVKDPYVRQLGAALITTALYTGFSKLPENYPGLPQGAPNQSFRPFGMMLKNDTALRSLGLKVMASSMMRAGLTVGIQTAFMQIPGYNKNPAYQTLGNMVAVGFASGLGGMLDFKLGLPLQAEVAQDGKVTFTPFKPNTNAASAFWQGLKTPGAGFYLSQAILGVSYQLAKGTMSNKEFKQAVLTYGPAFEGFAALAGGALGKKLSGETYTTQDFFRDALGATLQAGASIGLQHLANQSKMNPLEFTVLAWGAQNLLSGIAQGIVNVAAAHKNSNVSDLRAGLGLFAKSVANTFYSGSQRLAEDLLTFNVGYARAAAGPVVYQTPAYFLRAGQLSADVLTRGGWLSAIQNYIVSQLHYHTAAGLVQLPFIRPRPADDIQRRWEKWTGFSDAKGSPQYTDPNQRPSGIPEDALQVEGLRNVWASPTATDSTTVETTYDVYLSQEVKIPKWVKFLNPGGAWITGRLIESLERERGRVLEEYLRNGESSAPTTRKEVWSNVISPALRSAFTFTREELLRPSLGDSPTLQIITDVPLRDFAPLPLPPLPSSPDGSSTSEIQER
ncbi:MAG: hypothetical protein NC914_00010 [Candidatus Omnitrophica bacterium]|nr:hypothetical protein [Candidatus Omnitrophota bacterium]